MAYFIVSSADFLGWSSLRIVILCSHLVVLGHSRHSLSWTRVERLNQELLALLA
jgi:hypothetical protein